MGCGPMDAPSFSRVLRVCYCIQVSPEWFLLKLMIMRIHTFLPHSSGSRHHGDGDWMVLRMVLALSQPTLISVARQHSSLLTPSKTPEPAGSADGAENGVFETCQPLMSCMVRAPPTR
jgi:hypothetical protein